MTLQDLAAYAFERASLGDDDGARLVSVQGGLRNYFEILGVVDTQLGRPFSPADERLRSAVVVLTDEPVAHTVRRRPPTSSGRPSGSIGLPSRSSESPPKASGASI